MTYPVHFLLTPQGREIDLGYTFAVMRPASLQGVIIEPVRFADDRAMLKALYELA